jgi:hypothetical protein
MEQEMANLSEKQTQAIRLIDCGTRSQLTRRGNILVSAQATSLKVLGLIREAPERWIAYDLTPAGKRVLAESLAANPRPSAASKATGVPA